MKLRLTFKTPDAEEQAIRDALDDAFDCNREDREEARMEARLAAEQLLGKYLRFGEYVTLEADTEEGTVIVVPVC